MNILDNKYSKWYYSIIGNASVRVINGYCEKHHIVPKSLGGDNSKANLVRLSAREHFICHWLLIKMTDGDARTKMLYALYRMRASSTTKKMERYSTLITSRVYENLRGNLRLTEETKQRMRKPKSVEHRANISKSRQGITFTETHREALSASHRGAKSYERTDEHRELLSKVHKGKIVSEESRKKMSESHKGKIPWNKGISKYGS